MRRVSKKRAALLRIYLKRRELFLIRNPWCIVGGCPADQIHHRRGRIGADLLDESTWAPICGEHHRYVTDNPREAIERGWSLPRIGRAAS